MAKLFPPKYRKLFAAIAGGLIAVSLFGGVYFFIYSHRNPVPTSIRRPLQARDLIQPSPISQLPYQVTCSPGSEYPQCRSSQYSCADETNSSSKLCTLNPGITPDSIECGGSSKEDARQIVLCMSQKYECTHWGNANALATCTLK
jgi:hypothetical protein